MQERGFNLTLSGDPTAAQTAEGSWQEGGSGNE
jgi:hypothetical protein